MLNKRSLKFLMICAGFVIVGGVILVLGGLLNPSRMPARHMNDIPQIPQASKTLETTSTWPDDKLVPQPAMSPAILSESIVKMAPIESRKDEVIRQQAELLALYEKRITELEQQLKQVMELINP